MAPKLTEQQIIEYILACKTECIDTRKEISDTWDRLEALYLGHLDWSAAEDWQFKVNPGQVWRTCKNAMAVLSRILTNSPNYFSMEGVEFFQDKELAGAMDQALKFYFARAGRDGTSFLQEWREGSEAGLLYGLGCLKWGIRYQQDFLGRLYAELTCQSFDPRDLLFPMDESFHVHSFRKTVPDLKLDAQWGKYDKGRVTKLTNGDYLGGNDDYETRLANLGIKFTPNKFRPLVHLDEFWGDILTEDGDIALSNQRILVANERYILSKGANPYECGRHPFIKISPLRVLFRHLGAGIFDQCEGHQSAMTRMLNLLLDSELFRVMPMLEGDTSLAEDPEDLYTWEPGKVLGKKGQGQLLTPVVVQDIPAGAMNLIQLLKQDQQEHTSVNQWIMPATPKGNTTATEVSQKTGQSNAYFEQMAKDLEEQGIVESVSLAADLMIQMLSVPNAIVNKASRIFQDSGIILEQIANDPVARAEMYGSWDVKARGISLFFEKQESMDGLLQMGQMALQAPPDIQGMIKYDAYFRRLVDAMRISNPDEIVKTEEEIQQDKQNEPKPQPLAGMREMVDIDRIFPLLTPSEQAQVLTAMGIEPDMATRMGYPPGMQQSGLGGSPGGGQPQLPGPEQGGAPPGLPPEIAMLLHTLMGGGGMPPGGQLQ